MKVLTPRDIRSAILTGLTTGIIAWRILMFLGGSLPLGIPPWLLVPVVPVLWLAGVQLGYFLGTFFRPFVQFGRFAAIGFTNALVDFGVLYLGIALTGATAGIGYAGLKAFSFFVATLHSYYWNKTWAFEAASSRGGAKEAASFVSVALVSILVNVGVASAVVAVGPLFGLDERAWAGLGAVAGSASALVLSFVGFRLFVFGKK